MKICKIFLLLLIFSFCLPTVAESLASGSVSADDASSCITYKVEDFSKYKAGQFPTVFKTWPFQRGDAQKVYHVQEESGQKYLTAFDDKDLSEQIFREFSWNIKSLPYFKWKWRARTLPKGAAENNGATNDSACGVYVIFGKTSGTALKFVWSTTLAVGTVIERKPGEMAMQVLESGSKNMNNWQKMSVNIPEIYEKLLKHGMKRNPTGFALLTDGNATHSPAACDYTDFEISSGP
ncbi:MAG: DUF3047 domain-containing protein [Deltaproteobacteria bacterium]|nr:DUF3047 domain-containing protein [Deltaproteobacteria bacterium]